MCLFCLEVFFFWPHWLNVLSSTSVIIYLQLPFLNPSITLRSNSPKEIISQCLYINHSKTIKVKLRAEH